MNRPTILTGDRTTGSHHIGERLALEARRVIANGNETLQAFALRSQDAGNRTRFCSRATGATPSEFRPIWRGV